MAIYKMVKIFRLEYDLKGTNFKANVVAKDYDDAVSYLGSLLKQPFTVTAASHIGEIDLITPVVERVVVANVKEDDLKKLPPDDLLSANNVQKKRGRGRPKKNV